MAWWNFTLEANFMSAVHDPIVYRTFLFKIIYSTQDAEFSSYKSYVRLRHTSSYKLENVYGFFFRVTNSKLKNKKNHLELLTWKLNFHFSAFKILAQSWEI